MTVSDRLHRFVLRTLVGATPILLPAAAVAQEESGGLLQDNMMVVGLVVVVVAAILIMSRRKKPATTDSPASPAAANEAPAPEAPAAEEPAADELAATTFSAMGLMANADGPLNGDYFIIKQTGLTIGRDPATCDVVYEDSSVSREHARLEYTNDGLVVKNLSDMNQTFLNDQAVTEAGVKAGDRIRIENVTFKVLPHGASR